MYNGRRDFQELENLKLNQLRTTIIPYGDRDFNGLGERVLSSNEEVRIECILNYYSDMNDILGAVMFKAFGLGIDNGASSNYIINFIDQTPINGLDDFLTNNLIKKAETKFDELLKYPFITKNQGKYFFNPQNVKPEHKEIISKAKKHAFDIITLNLINKLETSKLFYE